VLAFLERFHPTFTRALTAPLMNRARAGGNLFSPWEQPNPITAKWEVTSGLKTGVASSPDTKKSSGRGWSAADVNEGEPLEEKAIVKFL